jgi:hypothetical protein
MPTLASPNLNSEKDNSYNNQRLNTHANLSRKNCIPFRNKHFLSPVNFMTYAGYPEKEKGIVSTTIPFYLFDGGKFLFSRSADRADPIVRKVLKRRPRFHSIRRIAFGRVVNVAANDTFITLHGAVLSKN